MTSIIFWTVKIDREMVIIVKFSRVIVKLLVYYAKKGRHMPYHSSIKVVIGVFNSPYNSSSHNNCHNFLTGFWTFCIYLYIF